MSVRWVGEGTNPISGLAILLMKPLIARRSKDDLRSLCRLVESTRP
jgi:hypothetical protein